MTKDNTPQRQDEDGDEETISTVAAQQINNDERRYPYTTTLTEGVQFVLWSPGMVRWVPATTDLVGPAYPVEAFPRGTFDEARNDEWMVDHGDVARVDYPDGEHELAYHPRVTDAPDDIVVIGETEVTPSDAPHPELVTDFLEDINKIVAGQEQGGER